MQKQRIWFFCIINLEMRRQRLHNIAFLSLFLASALRLKTSWGVTSLTLGRRRLGLWQHAHCDETKGSFTQMFSRYQLLSSLHNYIKWLDKHLKSDFIYKICSMVHFHLLYNTTFCASRMNSQVRSHCYNPVLCFSCQITSWLLQLSMKALRLITPTDDSSFYHDKAARGNTRWLLKDSRWGKRIFFRRHSSPIKTVHLHNHLVSSRLWAWVPLKKINK